MAFQHIGQRGFADSATQLFGIGIVFPVAGYALWVVGREAPREPVSGLDWLVAGIAVAAALMPIHLASKAALLPLSAYLLVTSARDAGAYRVGFIGLALTGAFIWGALLLQALAGPVLALDAALVQLATGVPVNGNVLTVDPAKSGGAIRSIIIMGGCSSLRNISQAIILWASLVQLCRLRVTRRLLIACVLSMAAVVVINVARIALIVAFPQHLVFIHEGPGASMTGLAALVAALAITGFAIVQEQRLDA